MCDRVSLNGPGQLPHLSAHQHDVHSGPAVPKKTGLVRARLEVRARATGELGCPISEEESAAMSVFDLRTYIFGFRAKYCSSSLKRD